MTLLEKIIEEKLLQDIIDLVSPLEEVLKPDTYSIHHLLPILLIEINKKEFRNNIHKIKLKYYNINLAVLEIIEKHKTSENHRLVFKIIRENLSLKHISAYIDLYSLYYTYRYKELYTQRTKEFILHESQEYYQIEIVIPVTPESPGYYSRIKN